MNDMRRDHTLACQKKLMETEDTRQGSTDAGLLTWKELLHSGRANGKMVNTNYNVAKIDVVATLPGRDELRWRTSPSDDRRLPQTCKVQRIMVVVRP